MLAHSEQGQGVEPEGAVTTVHRAARILKALSRQGGGGQRLSDVVQETALGKTTTHRILGALVETGLAFQDQATKRYRLGAAAVAMGQVALKHDFAGLARPALIALARETGDTVFASVREGSAAICVAREVGFYPIRTLTLDIGERRPLGVGAGSLALLASLSDAEVDQAIAHNLGWLTHYPDFNEANLRALVARTRDSGFALNEGRVVTGMSALGVAVLDRSGQAIGSLSLAAITSRMEGERRASLVAHLQREAEALSANLGAPSPSAARKIG